MRLREELEVFTLEDKILAAKHSEQRYTVSSERQTDPVEVTQDDIYQIYDDVLQRRANTIIFSE